MNKEIEIVGAGPAGLVAAINLAKAGYEVTVYEEKPDVGHRFHGDFQGLENWSSKEDVTLLLERFGAYNNLYRDFMCQPFNEVAVFDAKLSMTLIKSDKPFFYLVQRGNLTGCLDKGLFEIATELGVKVIFNKRVDKLEKGGIIGIGPRAADAIAKGIVFKTTMEDTAAAILDDRLAPKGYAYLLIHKNKATMATCMFKDFTREREWRSMGVTLAFFVALFTEMYGFPLTIYILTGVLGSRYPALNPFSHASGHLWLTFFGGGALMMTIIHLISNGLTIIGFVIMWNSWKLIHGAKGGLVTEGAYAYVRHPQYSGLFLIMLGMLIQWPTIITALMFPVLVFIYYRLSKREEAEMIRQFGDEYKDYMQSVTMFIPMIGQKS